MVKITINKLSDVNLDKIADFIFVTRQSSAFHSDSKTLVSVRRSLRETAQDDHNIAILAASDDEIVGTLQLYTGFPGMAFIDNWHPIVGDIANRNTTAQSLIKACKQHVKEIGLERLEVNLSPILDVHHDARDEYKLWYENSGFYRATKEAFMRVDLKSFSLSSQVPLLPEGLRFEEIDNVKNKEFERPFLESFRHGKDRLFLDFTPAQQMIAFNYWLDRNRPFHRASILVMKDEKVVGFSIARPKSESVDLGPVGVIPEYWRMGVMKAVLYETINRLREDNERFATLEADVDNTPAINLYKMYGFEQVYAQEYYAWRVK
jgi:ribosomal protein S18 acetylase RimI-like enzyme